MVVQKGLTKRREAEKLIPASRNHRHGDDLALDKDKVKKRFFKLMVLSAFISLLAGCSTYRYAAKDYDRYLMNNSGNDKLQTTTVEADYLLTKKTMGHRYAFRSFDVGYENVWVVEFGKMLESSLQSQDVQDSFWRLTRHTGRGTNGYLIVFDLKKYEFVDHEARVSIHISVSANGKGLFDKDYRTVGKAQDGKIFFGGVLAMQNAIRELTKSAIDELMNEFINDVNRSGIAAVRL